MIPVIRCSVLLPRIKNSGKSLGNFVANTYNLLECYFYDFILARFIAIEHNSDLCIAALRLVDELIRQIS